MFKALRNNAVGAHFKLSMNKTHVIPPLFWLFFKKEQGGKHNTNIFLGFLFYILDQSL